MGRSDVVAAAPFGAVPVLGTVAASLAGGGIPAIIAVVPG